MGYFLSFFSLCSAYLYNSVLRNILYIYIYIGLLEAGMRSRCQPITLLEKREGEKELCPGLSVWSG